MFVKLIKNEIKPEIIKSFPSKFKSLFILMMNETDFEMKSIFLLLQNLDIQFEISLDYAIGFNLFKQKIEDKGALTIIIIQLSSKNKNWYKIIKDIRDFEIQKNIQSTYIYGLISEKMNENLALDCKKMKISKVFQSPFNFSTLKEIISQSTQNNEENG